MQFLLNACLDATKGTLYPPVSSGSFDMLIIFCGWNGAAETPTDCASSTDLEIELLAYITNEDHQFSSKKKKERMKIVKTQCNISEKQTTFLLDKKLLL